MIRYRPMVKGDVSAGLALCRSAGWNQTADDWNLFLKLSPNGCRVAVDDDGRVRGTVATVQYEDRFSWIGMVLVDPYHQRQGIGIQLLARVPSDTFGGGDGYARRDARGAGTSTCSLISWMSTGSAGWRRDNPSTAAR